MKENTGKKTFVETVDDFNEYAKKKCLHIQKDKIYKMKYYGGNDKEDLIDQTDINGNLINALKKAGKGKEALYDICCKYIEFINFNLEKYGLNKHIDDLPILYTDLERKINLCKDMQSKEGSKNIELSQDEYNVIVNDLAKKYMVSERTIERDFRELRDGEVVFLGQTVTLDFKRRNGKTKVESSASPLFLVENLTQIITILNGLCTQSKNVLYKKFADETATSIWIQLSQYARDRIINELIYKMGLDKIWYNQIKEKAEEEEKKIKKREAFKKESEFDRNSIVMISKNNKPCYIKYIDNQGEEQELKEVFIYKLTKDGFLVKKDGKVLKMEINRASVINIESV